MGYYRDPDEIEANMNKADNLELLTFLWMEYFDSASYNDRKTPNEISTVGHRMNQRKIELRKAERWFNKAGECSTCRRPRQLCICDVEIA